MIIELIKGIIKTKFFKKGRFYIILKGPMKGLKILLSDNSQYAPIVGNWEPKSQYIFTKLIRKGDIVFDLGANIGIHTLLFSRLTGENGHVVAFEPLKENLQELDANIKVNCLLNIKSENIAISNSKGTSTFNIGIHNTQGSLNSLGNETGHKIVVNTTTLDNYIVKNNVRPNFLKIDVEGAENNVLKGFQEEIEICKPTIFVESHSKGNELFILEYLSKRGYIFYEQVEKNFKNDLNIKFLNKLQPNDGLFQNIDGTGTLVAIHDSKIKSIIKFRGQFKLFK